MTAQNMKQLNTMLMKELKKAMNVASQKMLADMYEETGKFYTKGEPKEYERTGALGDTPRTSPLTMSSNSVSFDAYLDLNYRYTSGKRPYMEDVLNLASYRITDSSVGKLYPTVGRLNWDKTLDKMNKTMDYVLGSFFIKI